MVYLVLFFLFVIIQLVYFKIANKFNIIDKPNNRSSHTEITLRGGGIIFPVSLCVAYFLGEVSVQLTIAVLMVGVVSFIDDIKPLNVFPRFLAHFAAIFLVIYELNLFSQEIWIVSIVVILMIGWVNAFNFMDGINGITVLYALTSIISFSLLSVNGKNLPILIIVGLSCFAFGIFNVRKKAKTFAGDVGSISMAVFLSYFMIKTVLETNQFGYLLFFSIYGIDTVVTILYRIKKKENILKPHRSHLYQYLVNEYGYPHLLIAFSYAGIQLLINLIVIYYEKNGGLNIYLCILFLVILMAVYLLIRKLILKNLTSKNVK